ncbi:hypothetical protein QUB80_07880 [Chlorogloeopsis sp. ULAP01]|uniref:hypothetical protein n=1 Tax=Chlorogloeopsis sp. ULAP01 TaxID=3056483 RepID=UPI0025AAB5FE|nr:hypothetical protein [Chlorogloeopsis sp. ULAP01]MDM9380624.1 hypothetical protein [Chlorogloeopsis sp. ULAP01]
MRYPQPIQRSKIYLLILAIVAFGTSSFTFILLYSSQLAANSSTSTSSHPTSIPWIESKLECEHTNRTWHDGKCWDDEHSQMF